MTRDGPSDSERAAYRYEVNKKLDSWSLRSCAPGKRWRDTGYFDVPGWVLREMAEEGLIEMRKLSGTSPTEWRK